MKWKEFIAAYEGPHLATKMCWDRISAFFNDDEKSALWMETKNPLLGNVSPIDMMVMGRHQKLMDFINNSLEGNRP